MTEVSFFRSDEVKTELSNLDAYCRSVNDSNAVHYKKCRNLMMIAAFISSNVDMFDLRCVCNIKWFGRSMAGSSRNINAAVSLDDVDLYLVLFYRLVSEFNISTPDGIYAELNSFLSFVESHYASFSQDNKRQFDYVKYSMPTAMLKNLLNSEGIGYLGNVPRVAEDVKLKVDSWGEVLSNHIKIVDDLKSKLEVYENAYNFVGLSKGFGNLYKRKCEDLKQYRCNMRIFGGVILAVLLMELWFLRFGHADFDSLSIPLLGSIGLISLSITLLLVYFFRIALKSADSTKAQLVQIELRMTLCEFVQSYSVYASEIKTASPDTLTKFESVIFSNINIDDEKMVSLFEGMEQVGSFIKATKGN